MLKQICKSCKKKLKDSEEFIIYGKYPSSSRIWAISNYRNYIPPQIYGKLYHKTCYLRARKEEKKRKWMSLYVHPAKVEKLGKMALEKPVMAKFKDGCVVIVVSGLAKILYRLRAMVLLVKYASLRRGERKIWPQLSRSKKGLREPQRILKVKSSGLCGSWNEKDMLKLQSQPTVIF